MVQEEVLDKLASEDLMVHVVWTPVLPSDQREAVPHAREAIHDPRVQHYWDADLSLGTQYAEFVELPPDNNKLAWDIYFVFEPGTKWEQHPPEPADWWHQLAFDERYLADGEGLRQSIANLLAQ